MNTKEIREGASNRLRAILDMHAGYPPPAGMKPRVQELQNTIDLCDEVDRLREALKECREAVGYTGSYDEVHAIVKAALNPKEKK